MKPGLALAIWLIATTISQGATRDFVHEVIEIDSISGGGSSMTIGKDGLPVFTYMKAHGYKECLWLAKCHTQDCKGDITKSIVDSSASYSSPYYHGPRTQVGALSSVKIGVDGLPVIAYIDVWAGKVKLAHCGNATCSEKNSIYDISPIAKSITNQRSTHLIIGPDSLPAFIYMTGQKEIAISKCSKPDCGSGVTTTYPIPIPENHMPTFIIQGNGFPQIFPYNATGGYGYGKCTDVRCRGIETIRQNISLLPMSISVQTDAQGYQTMAMTENMFRHLYLLRCRDRFCISNLTTTVIDSGHSSGWSPTLILSKEGNPIIAYQDFDKQIKVAFCSDAACQKNTVFVQPEQKSSGLLENFSVEILPDGTIFVAFTGNGKVKALRIREAIPSSIKEPAPLVLEPGLRASKDVLGRIRPRRGASLIRVSDDRLTR